MEFVILEQDASFAFGQSITVNGKGLIGHGIAHETGERDNNGLFAGRSPFLEAAVGSRERSGTRDFVWREHAFNGSGGIGDITDDDRAMEGFEEFQTFLE